MLRWTIVVGMLAGALVVAIGTSSGAERRVPRPRKSAQNTPTAASRRTRRARARGRRITLERRRRRSPGAGAPPGSESAGAMKAERERPVATGRLYRLRHQQDVHLLRGDEAEQAPQLRPIRADIRPARAHGSGARDEEHLAREARTRQVQVVPRNRTLPESHGRFEPQLLGSRLDRQLGQVRPEYRYEFGQGSARVRDRRVLGETAEAGYIFKDAQTKKLKTGRAFNVRATHAVRQNDEPPV